MKLQGLNPNLRPINRKPGHRSFRTNFDLYKNERYKTWVVDQFQYQAPKGRDT